MKKRIAVMLISMLLLFSMSGCGKKEKEATTEAVDTGISSQEEIVKLVNTDLPGISAERDAAVTIYNDYFASGTDADSETWKNRLEKEALPTYDSYLDKLKGLSYENAEVQNLIDLFVKSSENQREAIQHVINSVTELDTDELTNAQQCITDSETYLKMYEDGLESLCNKYNIEIVGEFQTSTMTDASNTDAD